MLDSAEGLALQDNVSSLSEAIGFPDKSPGHRRFANIADAIVTREAERQNLPGGVLAFRHAVNDQLTFSDYATLSLALEALQQELPRGEYYEEWFALLMRQLFDVHDQTHIIQIAALTKRSFLLVIPEILFGRIAIAVCRGIKRFRDRVSAVELVETISCYDERFHDIRERVEEYRIASAEAQKAKKMTKNLCSAIQRIPQIRSFDDAEKEKNALEIERAVNTVWDEIVTNSLQNNVRMCGYFLAILSEAKERLLVCGVKTFHRTLSRIDVLESSMQKTLTVDEPSVASTAA